MIVKVLYFGRLKELSGSSEESVEVRDGARIEDLFAHCSMSRPELRSALEEGKFRERVRGDFMAGVRSGVNGTPTFFVNGHRQDGGWEYEDLVRALESRLAAR